MNSDLRKSFLDSFIEFLTEFLFDPFSLSFPMAVTFTFAAPPFLPRTFFFDLFFLLSFIKVDFLFRFFFFDFSNVIRAFTLFKRIYLFVLLSHLSYIRTLAVQSLLVFQLLLFFFNHNFRLKNFKDNVRLFLDFLDNYFRLFFKYNRFEWYGH